MLSPQNVIILNCKYLKLQAVKIRHVKILRALEINCFS
jgi:hypothetical protein